MLSRESNTRGVVISRSASGEGSIRVSLYTEQFGLVWALAKSAREERSKLRPHLQAGTFGYFTLVKGSREWRLVGAVDTKNIYFVLGGREAGQKSALRVLGVVRQLIRGEGADAKLFDSLWNFLNSLERFSADATPIAERVVLIAILFQSGYISEKDLPESFEDGYSPRSLEALKNHEKTLTRTINEGFAASGLV